MMILIMNRSHNYRNASKGYNPGAQSFGTQNFTSRVGFNGAAGSNWGSGIGGNASNTGHSDQHIAQSSSSQQKSLKQLKRIFVLGQEAPMYFIDAIVVPDFKSVSSNGSLHYVQSAEQFAVVICNDLFIGGITKEEPTQETSSPHTQITAPLKSQPCKWFPVCKKGAQCKWYHDPRLGPSKDILKVSQMRLDITLEQLPVLASSSTKNQTLLFNGALIMQALLYRQMLKNLNM